MLVPRSESFNARFRDECLNAHWFLTLVDPRRQIETWRLDYNHVRPHSSLGDVRPSEFAEAGLRRAKPASTPLPPPTQKAENQG